MNNIVVKENINPDKENTIKNCDFFKNTNILPKCEFGKDITNLKDNLNIKEKLKKSNRKTLYNLLRPSKREREELTRVKNELIENQKNRRHSMKNSISHLITDESTCNYTNMYKNPQTVNDYLDDILDDLLSDEKEKGKIDDYMKNQPDINEKMRGILIDWMIGVHMEFRLRPETLFLSVYLIDKYMEKKPILKTKLQLLGVTSLFISSKYEEIYAPELIKFVNITENAFTKNEILEMEWEILKILEFNITTASPLRFLEIIFQKCVKLNDEIIFMSRYLIELVLMDYKMIKYNPSIIAGACLYVAIKIKNYERNVEISRIICYSEEKLKECAKDILIIYEKEELTELRTLKIKYSSGRYLYVARR